MQAILLIMLILIFDYRTRVRGVTGLRVADASVLPSPISGTTNTILTAVGERAADLILLDYL